MNKAAHPHCFLFFLAMQILINSVFAQKTSATEIAIKGTVIDSTTKLPVEFATAILFKANKDVVRTSSTAIDGTFKLPVDKKDNYVICISLIGYKKYFSREISINNTKTIDLGIIYLQEESNMMGEVVVKSKKKITQIKDDKLVYNAKADIGNKSGSATDVLRNTPMIAVDADGGIKLRGNSNIKVLINGLPSNIMAKNLKEALKSIPAGSIESIEVITTPSAKYEAEGAAGIINIITKKKTSGTNGNVDLTAGNREQSANAEVSITKEKCNYNLSLGSMREKEIIASELRRTSLTNGIETGKLSQNNHTTQRYAGSSIEFSADYQTDSTQKIGTSISYWNDHMPLNGNLYNSYESTHNKLEYNQATEQKNDFGLIDFSVNYQKKFKRKGQELQFISQYSANAEKSYYKTKQSNLSGQPYFDENGSNTSDVKDLGFQTDYSHPFDKTGKNILETGMRYGRSNSRSNYSVSNNILSEDTSRSDDISYSQNILAAYLSLKFELPYKIVIRPGLRYEITQIEGDFKRNEPSFKASFDNWVPSILISKKMGGKHDFKLNYTERIRRPEIWDLNPYVNASDPLNIAYGNPYLRPEITRMVELGYLYGASSGLSITNSLFFNSNKNGIEYISIVDSSGISRTTPQNIATIQRTGANTNLYMPINEKWIVSCDIEIYHIWFDSKVLKLKNEANFCSIGINSSYTLPSDFTIQLSADYNNGLATLQGKSSSYYTYRLSVGKELFNDKASLSVNINNPFRSSQPQSNYLYAPTFYSKTFDRHYDRSFTVSFSWRFGGFQSQDRNNASMPDKESKKEGVKKRLPSKK